MIYYFFLYFCPKKTPHWQIRNTTKAIISSCFSKNKLPTKRIKIIPLMVKIPIFFTSFFIAMTSKVVIQTKVVLIGKKPIRTTFNIRNLYTYKETSFKICSVAPAFPLTKFPALFPAVANVC